MVSALTFLAVFLIPLLLFFFNSGIAAKERRGIAAGIPRPKGSNGPKVAKPPKAPRTRTARVRARRVDDCGRNFTHFALDLFGSQESCRYCRYLEDVTPANEGGGGDSGNAPAPAANEPLTLVRPAND